METVERLKELLSKPSLTKTEKKEITLLASEYSIELECTTCNGWYTKAIIDIIEAIESKEQIKTTSEILKPQYQRGVYIGGVFVCEHNANDYMTLIERYAPNILAI